MKRYLFICQHNFSRSKYSAKFFQTYLKGVKKSGKVYSAGLGFISHFLGKRVNKKMVKKMDRVFVMERYMKDYLIKNFSVDKKKIVVLNIKDVYGFLRKKPIGNLDKILRKFNWKKYLC